MRARDPRSLADFFEATFDRAYSLAFRLLGTLSATDVAVQEVYVRIFRTTSRLNPTLDVELWMDSITYAVVEDLRRGSGKDLAPASSLPESGNGIGSLPSTPDPPNAREAESGPDEAARGERLRRDRRVQDVLKSLPARARDPLVLSQYQGLPLPEVASILGRREVLLERELPRDLQELGRRLREGEEPTSPEELREAGRAALSGLSDVFPDPNLRDRIRRGFVLGHLASNAEFFAPPRPWWVSAVRWGYIPAALAGFLVLGAIMNRGPEWTLVHTGGTGSLEVDGQTYSLSDPDGRPRLHAGAHMELASHAPLLLLSRGNLVLEVENGTSLRIPDSPGRWFGKRVRGELEAGTIRVMTGPGFARARLDLETPRGLARIKEGVAEITSGEATRVELLDGEAELGADGTQLTPVPAGTSIDLGREGVWVPVPLPEPQIESLRAFGETMRPILVHTTETGDGAS